MDDSTRKGIDSKGLKTETTHSPLPWRAVTEDGELFVRSVNGATVLNVTAGYEVPEDAANAAFIVKCVNAHDRLVKVNRTLVEALGWASQYIHGAPRHLCDCPCPTCIMAEKTRMAAQAALALAKGEVAK